MATTQRKAAKILRLAGWLQVGLAMTMGVALVFTWRTFLARPTDLGVRAQSALVSADQALAGAEVTLEAARPRIMQAQEALQDYARFSASMADTTAETVPLLRAWGEDSRGLGSDAQGLGSAIETWGLVPAIKKAGTGIRQRGERLRETGDKILKTADSLEKNGLPAIRRTAETLQGLGKGEIESSTRQMLESVGSARATVQLSLGMVGPALGTARLTCGVYAAMTLVLLSCGVTTVLLGHALAAEVSGPTAAADHRQPAG